MGGKRRPHRNRRAPSTQEHHETAKGLSVPRGLQLLSVALAAALLITVVLALLNKPAEVGENSASPSAASQDEMVRRGEREHSTFVVPAEAERIDVEKLEAELIDLAEHLQTSYPQDAQALLVAGSAYAGMQQSAQALPLLRRCVALAPQQSAAAVRLAEILILEGEDAQAVDVLRASHAQGPASAQAMRVLAEALSGLGQVEEATGVLKQCVREFPAESQNWLRLGQMQILVRCFEEAEASLRQSMDLGEDGTPVLIALHTALARQGKREEAEEVRKRLGDLESRDPVQADGADDPFQAQFAATWRENAYRWLVAGAIVCLDHGERLRAEGLLKRAVSLDPKSSESYVLLSSLYQRDGRLLDVIAVLSRLVELEPENGMHAIRLAAVAGQCGQDGLAEQVLQQALPRDTDGAVHFMLAQLYVSQGRAAEARRNAEVAAERRQDVDGYLLLRSTCEAVGDRAAASEALRKAKRLAPNDPRLGGHPEPS